ncbi:MAG: Non-specific protein-tyrosine kinase [Deltaproteobacteria bacterium]|nr:Non-specific protein-tyrosine kinase [Deltaproteobacteria bacterium]
MSRIEKALEKAAQLRAGDQPAPQEDQQPVVTGRIEKALEKTAQLRAGERPVPQEDKQPIATVPAGTGTMAAKLSKSSPIVSISTANPMLTTITDPYSAVSEQYRKLKSSIVRMTNLDNFRNLIMIASAVAGEGKSMTAVNLAVSMAQELDLTVLLIDADLRRPSIHSYLGLESSLGLSDCLLDGVDLGAAIVKTDIGKLSIIPAGKEVANPLELFNSRKMQDLLEEIKHRYSDRYVIIDTPPLLPFAEARLLGQLVDGIVFVIQEGMAPKESIQEAIETLKGCSILGVVLNNSTTVSNETHHYGSYYKRAAE